LKKLIAVVPPAFVGCSTAESAALQSDNRIALAESAGPAAIASSATVVDFATGAPVVLRKGTNGWLCVPDDPSTPGVEPVCLMILVPDPARALAGLSRDPTSGGPYVMWVGTDYAHIMVPIAPNAGGAPGR